MGTISPRASIVMPAHNEAAVIGRTLSHLLADAEPGEFDVVVSCNACTDDTAQIAAGFAGVRILDIATASKVAALNAGDDAAATFPRVYLDADISMTTATLRSVVETLDSGALAAAPLPVLDLSGCSVLVRLYFAIWSRLGYTTRHVLGSGVYALSHAGRARFSVFPDLIADDGFVYTLFGRDERVNPPGATFTIQAPRTARAMVRRRTRIALGNLQLQQATGRCGDVPGPHVLDVIRRHPWLAPAACVYVIVNGLARLSALTRLKSGRTADWNRDETTRKDAA